jgi:ataxia telangiectasia mutated family protein
VLTQCRLVVLVFPFYKVLLVLCSTDYPKNAAITDRINIFRPDRVFMFITEMHYRMSAACHHRHTRHHLAALEELTILLGHRALVPSSLK